MLKLRQYQTVLVTCWRCFLYEVKFALYLQTHNVSYFLCALIALVLVLMMLTRRKWWKAETRVSRISSFNCPPTTTVYHPAVRCTFLSTCTRAWMNKKLDEKKTKRDPKGLMSLGIYAARSLILSKLDIMWSNQKTPREGR